LSGDGLCVGFDSGDPVSNNTNHRVNLKAVTSLVKGKPGKEKYSDLHAEAERALVIE